MKLIFCIIITVLVFREPANGINVVDYIPPIKGFLRMLDLNLRISVLVCWNYGEKYDFLRVFNREGESYQILIKSDTVENIPYVDDEHLNLIVTDLRCNNSVGLYQRILQMSSFRWIGIFSRKINVTDYFKDVPLQINSEIYCLNKSEDIFNFYEVYKKTLNSEISITPMASFGEGRIVDRRIHPSIIQRRKNLQGSTLRASLVITHNNTLNHLDDYREKHIDTITKSNYHLTNFLMEYLNATVTYSFVSQWGYMNPRTGKWSGMIGDLVENRSDIGATALFMTSDRIKYIEYISMPTPTLSKFVFRSPKLSYTDDVFLLPFDKFVWYCLVALFFISAISLIVTVFIEWHCLTSLIDSSDASILQPSFYDTCVLVLAAVCQQGSSVAPRSITARIVMVITYITLMFLYTSYSGNITALLQSPSTKIQTLEDLLNSRLKFGADDTVFNRYYFPFVWYCLVALFFISAISLIVTVFIEWHCLTSLIDSSDASILQPSFYDTCVLVLAAVCQQGSSVAPRSITARIVMVITYITLMFLYTSYSGNITALLQSPSTKIQTLEDLLNSRLKFGADDTVFNRYYFPHATEPIRRKIYEQKIHQKDGSENFLPLAEGVERIRHGLYAFHMELGVGYKVMGETFLEDEKCGLQEIQYLQVIDPWYAIQKNSSYKQFLKAGMMRLRELGLQDRENSRLYTKKPQCLGGGGKFITASLVDIRSALLILAYGFVSSISLLAVEKAVWYYVQKMKKRENEKD